MHGCSGCSVVKSISSISKVVVLQAIIVAVFSLLAFSNGHNQGWSSMVGGGIALVGSLVYALMIMGKLGDAARVMKAHFRAEMMKMLVVATFFILALSFSLINSLWLIVSFAVASLTYWFALLVV